MAAQEYNFKLGEPVLYRYPQYAWRFAIWGGDTTHDTDGCIRPVLEIIPLEGNEHLHGTFNDVKPKRWRAQVRDKYFCIDRMFVVTFEFEDNRPLDNARYEAGNYFKTEQEAEDAMQKVINVLKS